MKSTEPLGVAAVRLGYATPDQIQSALEEQQTRTSRGGKNALIGLVMEEMGILTAEQLLSILNQYDNNHIPVSDDAIRLAARFKATLSDDERMMLFTCGYGLEGNTTIVTQIAVALSLMNQGSVLMVDANLRTPSLNKWFNLEQTPGLSEVLSKQCTIDEAISTTEVPNLSLLPSGDVVVNFMSLLLSDQCGAIFDELRSRYRYILVDSPPILQTPDAPLIASRADGVVLIVSNGIRRKQDVYEMKRILGSINSRILGVILSEHEHVTNDIGFHSLYKKLIDFKARKMAG